MFLNFHFLGLKPHLFSNDFETMTGKIQKLMLRILYDDFDQKVKNIHDDMDLHHSYKIKYSVFIFLMNIKGGSRHKN